MTADNKSHSLFSPSSSERWWNCAFSVKANADAPRKTSIYAAEGTAAHELAANILNKLWVLKTDESAEEWIGEKIEVEDFIIEVTEDMANAVQVYIDEIKRIIATDNGQGKMYIEMWQPLTLHDEACGGTLDAMYVSDVLKKIYVRDYKHGAGYAVEADDNRQLLQYGATLLDAARHIMDFDLGIVQPRKAHTGGAVRSKVYSRALIRDYLLDMSKKILDIKTNPNEAKSGKWCKWCAISGNCKAQMEDKSNAIINQLDSAALVPTLTPEQMRKALDMEDEVLDFFKALRERVMDFASNGGTIPGYKRVEKFGHRKWKNEESAATVLELSIGDAAYEKKLLSPAKAEKLFGKGKKGKEDFQNNCGDLVETPSTGFALVPVDDAREPHETKVISQFDAVAAPVANPVIDLSDIDFLN